MIRTITGDRVANNRMWFKNKKTGGKILLAKYYPSTGWYVYYEDIAARIEKELDANSIVSQTGNADWQIEYEGGGEDDEDRRN
jgi:hypothetical protein